MRLVRPMAYLTAAMILSALPWDAAAGKRRSPPQPAKIAGGYAIAQIGRAVSVKPKAALAGFESSRQLKACSGWREKAASRKRGYGLDSDALIHPPAHPNDPILKEFGLPYIPGVPTIAVLLPPPAADEF